MSKSKDNSLTKSYSGKFGNDIVFRTRDNMSIMAKPPRKSSKEPAESQIEVRRRFKMAARWAKQALQDPNLLAFYQSKADGMRTPYAIAVGDYLKLPEIIEIDVNGYNGDVGDKIRVVAFDNVEVKSVQLTITGSDGLLIESGPCVEDINNDGWFYTATVAVPDTAGVVITAEAKDTPGHPGILDITL